MIHRFNGAGCELNLWDIRTKKQLSEMKGHQQGVECVAFVPGREPFTNLKFNTILTCAYYMIFIMIRDKSSAPTKFPTPQEPPAPPS